MSMPSLIKIPEGSPGALPGALGCLCQPGPSFPVARGKPGVPAVQNEQGRKWDIQGKKSATRVLFARDLDRLEDSATARPPMAPGPVPSGQKKFTPECFFFCPPPYTRVFPPRAPPQILGGATKDLAGRSSYAVALSSPKLVNLFTRHDNSVNCLVLSLIHI